MLNIFNPSRVFRDSFPASWCENIKSYNQNIPILKSDSPPTLLLDAELDSEYFIGVLPIVRSWADTSLSTYRLLKFNVVVTDCDFPTVGVTLTSRSESGEETDSKTIELSQFGLMEDCEQEFIIPLPEFNINGFDISRVKMIKFVGYGHFSMKLSRIRIE